jgi:hypothetical protein
VSAPPHLSTSPGRYPQILRRYAPVLLALVGLAVIYGLIAERFALGGWLLLPTVILILGALFLGAVLWGRAGMRRVVGVLLLAVITGAETLAVAVLLGQILALAGARGVQGGETGVLFLRDAALIWLVNILTFSFWFWALDSGGPERRHRDGYRREDLLFPQHTIAEPGQPVWCPRYVDYLFLAFNTSVAFSPTDTLVLSVRAKALMMLQATVSLVVLVVIGAWAINSL